MNFPARGPRAGWSRRLRRRAFKLALVRADVLSTEAFLAAIAKERCRAERRDLTFCIVRMEFAASRVPPAGSPSNLTDAFRQRLRITDEIGEFESAMGVLLPETPPSQAAVVANDLVDIARRLGYDATSDIYVWPLPDDVSPANQSGEHDGSFLVSIEAIAPGDNGAAASGNGSQNANGDGSSDGNGNGHAVRQEHGVAVTSLPKTESSSSGSVRVRPLSFSLPVPWWKRGIDLMGAFAGLIVLSPILGFAALATRLSSSGPVVFRQWREGKDGRLFRIYKFRTMRVGAEAEQGSLRQWSEQDGPAFKIKDDPRLTLVGKYLRRTCVDELPQLFNVLKGEMSLVGPRPLPADESLDCTRWQRRRLDVQPGMTCFWQVTGGREIPFDEWMRMDLRYVRRHGPVTDAVVLVKTLIVTLMHRGSV